jgi:CRP-like cAMP-binding protein
MPREPRATVLPQTDQNTDSAADCDQVACHQGRASRAGDILRMKTGDVFGESFLEPTAEDAVRKANVVAVGPVTVLRLTAMAFREQLGNLQVR